MPVSELLYRQVAELCRFFEPSPARLWVLRCVKDLQPVILKILAGIQDHEDNGNIFVYFDAPFLNADHFYGRVLEQFEAELVEMAGGFAAVGLAVPPAESSTGPILERFVRRTDAVANLLPEGSGSLVFIFDPAVVSNESRLVATLADLASRSQSNCMKFLILDHGTSTEMDRLRDAGGQEFRVEPAAIEAQVEADLAGDDLTPTERRQYLAMAGSFAFAKGKVERAAELQLQVLAQAAEEGEPNEVAFALYSLGNTKLKARQPAAAEKYFTDAAELCAEIGNDNLLALVMINLGVALLRQGKAADAVRSFDVARLIFRGLNQLSDEVHALDTKAIALAEAKQPDAARRAWQEALGLVDGMTNESFAHLRDSCREDLTGKLAALSSARSAA